MRRFLKVLLSRPAVRQALREAVDDVIRRTPPAVDGYRFPGVDGTSKRGGAKGKASEGLSRVGEQGPEVRRPGVRAPRKEPS